MNKLLLEILGSIGDYIILIGQVIRISFRRPPQWALLREHFYNIGVLSLPVVAITGFSTGLVLSVQSFFQLSDKGLTGATGLMVTKAMMVELGPILTAFMVTGRVGSAMCAEIGTMKVTEQIDALKSMAIDPIRYLIAPRFIAGIIMIPFLSVFSCVMGVLGGFIISVYHFGMTPSNYMDPIPIHIIPFDFISGIIKSCAFGIFLVSISCYQGLKTSGGAAGVGRTTTSSVVICYSVILVSNFVLTLALTMFYNAVLKI